MSAQTTHRWTAADIPPQHGRAAVVTGTGGIGFETALALAGAAATLAGRNPERGANAVARIRAAAPGADVRLKRLDLTSLASIAAFAAQLQAGRDRLDLLVNNAGVMVPPTRRLTADGFELQFGVNHLGHFAIAAHLLPLLRRGAQPRVVALGGIAAQGGAMDFDDLNAEPNYRPMAASSRS